MDATTRALGPALLTAALAGPAGDAHARGNLPPPRTAEPVEVAVTVRVNKTYNVDTIDETYVVDGYLELQWTDPRLAFEPAPGAPAAVSYQNALAEEAIGREVWSPLIEFINVVGAPEIPNQELLIEASGTVTHSRRFLATFTSDMDFRRYPFDTQDFRIQIESFVYDSSRVVFVRPQAVLASAEASEEWEILERRAYVNEQAYPHLADGETYSRFNVDVTARRQPGYFVWQIFLPLALIIVTSWLVFWIKEFGDRLATSCTLMLTVVAFNFFVSTMLPRLPYNTFIEVVIISGYISIFLAIVAILTISHVRRSGREALARSVNAALRWLFPSTYAGAMVMLAASFF